MDHELIVRKVRRVGQGGNLFVWFETYLTERHQIVIILGKTSRPVLSRVPHVVTSQVHSVFGLLLFLVYLNNLPENATWSSVALLADDTKCLSCRTYSIYIFSVNIFNVILKESMAGVGRCA